jgi:hypothetical protein
MRTYRITLLIFLFLSACSLSTGQLTTPTVVEPVVTATTEVTETAEPTITPTATSEPALTATQTPTIELTPTAAQNATPTFAFPTATVNKQAHCRYGPSVAYLHAADLYPGDIGTVRGRFIYSQWLYVKFDKLNYFCWVAPSVVEVVGDLWKLSLM